MAPVICMADGFSMPRGDVACPYSRRRPRNRPAGIAAGKHRAVESRLMAIGSVRSCSPHSTPPSSPISEPDKPINLCLPNSPESSMCARIPIDCEDQWIIMKRRQGLLNIVARTIALMRRNHILEKKVEALRQETRTFINSVLNNPENQTMNERRQEESKGRTEDSQIDERVSSSTDDKMAWPVSASVIRVESPKRKVCTDRTVITSTCNSSTSFEDENRSPDTLVR